jgi:hypothetical protein
LRPDVFSQNDETEDEAILADRPWLRMSDHTLEIVRLRLTGLTHIEAWRLLMDEGSFFPKFSLTF